MSALRYVDSEKVAEVLAHEKIEEKKKEEEEGLGAAPREMLAFNGSGLMSRKWLHLPGTRKLKEETC